MSVVEEAVESGSWCVVCNMPFIESHGRPTMCNFCNGRGNKTTVHGAQRQVHPTALEAGIEVPGVGSVRISNGSGGVRSGDGR